MAILFVFKLSLLTKNKIDDEKYYDSNWAEYEPTNNIVELTILVDVLSIFLMVGLVFNYGLILLSIRRLIQFLKLESNIDKSIVLNDGPNSGFTLHSLRPG